MIETVQSFINRISERKHVLLLFENKELEVRFITKEQTFSIAIENGKVHFLSGTAESNDLEIHGDFPAFKELLEGKETLRALVKKGKLQASAPFRTLLLLESLFYFGKIDMTAREIV